MNDEDQTLTTTDEQKEAPKPARKKSNRASGKSSGGNPQPAPKETPEVAQKTTRDGKPVRKTASGFTVVG